MRHASLLIAVSFLAVSAGCKQAIEAPSTIEEMMNFGFVHFNGEAGELDALSHNLIPFVDEHLEEAETGWQVNSLSVEDLTNAGINVDEVENVVGATASVPYASTVDQVLLAISWPDKTEVLDNVKEYEILASEDLDCFLAHECSRYEMTVAQVAKAGILGEATQTITFQFQWVTREDDGLTFFATRVLCPDGVTFGSNLAKVIQQYSFALVYPSGGHARRMEAFWVDGKIVGMDVPEDFAVNQAINQMQKAADQIDAFVDGLED